MRKGFILLILLAVPAFAQETAAPALDAIDRGLVASVADAGQIAQAACNQLPAFKHYNGLSKAVVAQIEAKHPGYTLDFNTGVLKVKVPR